MLHSVAFTQVLPKGTSVGGPGAMTAMHGLLDSWFSLIGSGPGYQVPADLKIVAAYAVAPSLALVQLQAPSMLRVGYPYVRPTDLPTSGTDPVPPRPPSICTLIDCPAVVRAGESLNIFANNNNGSGGTDNVHAAAIVWVCDRPQPIPPGEGFWLRYTSTTISKAPSWGASGPWYPLAVTFEPASFPPGRYAVIGFEHISARSIAARLVFPGSAYRPATVAQGAAVNSGSPRTHDLFYGYGGSLGVFGTFDSFSLPSVEVLVYADDEGDGTTPHQGGIRVVRLGDSR